MPFAAIPFLLIPYDSLTHLLGLDPGETSQSLPATAVFSLFYILMRRGQLRVSVGAPNVLRNLLLATACIVAVTLANIIAEANGFGANTGIDADLRLSTALRQGVSLALGLSTFLMFQDALLRIGWQAAFRWILLGGIPSLGLCVVQFLQGSFRVQGFSSEPSLLADMLVLAFLPACAYANINIRQRLVPMFAGLATLMASFSGTGIMKAVFALFSFSAVRGKILRGLVIVSVALVLTYAVLSYFPDNYIFLLIDLFKNFLDSGTLVGGSFIDRFFGFAAPVEMLRSAHGWLGFGLGGDTVYFDQIFDADTAAAIRQEKASVASISSLQAKVLLYGGVVGYGLYVAAWWRAWRATRKDILRGS